MLAFSPPLRQSVSGSEAACSAADDCRPNAAPAERAASVLQRVRETLAETRRFFQEEAKMHETYNEMQAAAKAFMERAGELEDGGRESVASAMADCAARYSHAVCDSRVEGQAAFQCMEPASTYSTASCNHSLFTAAMFCERIRAAAMRLALLEDVEQNAKLHVTGRIVWPACQVLCEHLASGALPGERALEGCSVLELGSGLGALGLYAAYCCGAARVLLTDLPDALPLLQRSVAEQLLRAARPTGPTEPEVDVIKFDWRDEVLPPEVSTRIPMDLVIGSDVAYSAETVVFLVQAIRKCSGPETRICVSTGNRPGEVGHFRERCFLAGLRVEAEARYPSETGIGPDLDTWVFELKRLSNLELLD